MVEGFSRKRRPKWVRILILLTALAVLGLAALELGIRPILGNMAEAYMRSIAVRCLNEAAIQECQSADFSDIVQIHKDEAGEITMVTTNPALMNIFSALIANRAQQRVQESGELGIGVPLGALFGGQIFGSTGPKVTIHSKPVSSVTTQFESSVDAAGINQTRHRIYARMNMWIRVMFPSGSKVIEVETMVMVYEGIIVGQVPDTYISGIHEDDILNLVP